MTTSELIRLIVAIVLILVYVARRYRWFEYLREAREKKQREDERKRHLASRKNQRQQVREVQQTRRKQTAEMLRRGLGLLHQKSLRAAGQEIWYLDSGTDTVSSPTVVLLHGFAGDKENWTEVGNRLAQLGYRVVAPDLPGFGQNEKNADLAYDVTSQARRLRAFLQQLKLKHFHMVGHSVGGSIAAAITYAAQNVVSLTLIEPFGVHVPYPSELDKLLEQDRNPMVIANPAAFNNLLGFVHHAPVEMPPALKKRRAEQAAQHRVFYLKVWKDVREGERAYLLDLLLPEIKTRTLVLQGAESGVIHPSTPEIIQSMMRGAEVAVLEDCGHFPMLEKPQVTTTRLEAFLTQSRNEAPPEPSRRPEGHK